MEYIWILPITFVILLQFSAIVVVANEDILYSTEEKTKIFFFIIFVPIIGAIIELRKLDKYARYHKDKDGNEVMDYAFWEYYTTSQSGGNDGGFGGSDGSDGGGGCGD